MNALTFHAGQSILSSPLTHSAVGIGTLFLEGQKMTAPLAVFFRLSFRAALVRFTSVMAGLFGLPSGRPRLLAVVPTHSNPPPKSLEPLRGGYSIFRRINRMNTNFPGHQSAQQNPQTKTVSLFDCFLHRRQIAFNIPGTKAERIKRHHPAVIVKFVGFEASMSHPTNCDLNSNLNLSLGGVA